MLGSSKLMAFLSTANPAESIRFYRDKLGLTLQEDSTFALVFDANGIMLRIQKVKESVIAPYTALGWQVDDIAAVIRGLARVGVHMERFPGLPQDELGVWSPGGHTKIAWLKDPEGHLLSLTQF
jgi:catechol 2,3-dioxygenase-like lactoylglutathione lyase family enzyme